LTGPVSMVKDVVRKLSSGACIDMVRLTDASPSCTTICMRPWSLFLDLHYLPAIVHPAVGAHAMGQFGAVALRALAHAGSHTRMGRPPGVSTSPGRFSLGDRH